jgi:pyruvate,water dikinase
MPEKESLDKLINDLRERAKELTCLYEVQELLNQAGSTVNEIFSGVIKAIPPGWQYPDICRAKIIFRDKVFQSPDFNETAWVQSADIKVQDESAGRISVYYTAERPLADE